MTLPLTLAQNRVCKMYYDKGRGCGKCPIQVPCEEPIRGRLSLATIEAHTTKLERAAQKEIR